MATPPPTSHTPYLQLDILAGHRSGSGEVGGTLLVNGRAMASEAFQRLSCYVLQRDVLLASRCGVESDGAVCVSSVAGCVWGGWMGGVVWAMGLPVCLHACVRACECGFSARPIRSLLLPAQRAVVVHY